MKIKINCGGCRITKIGKSGKPANTKTLARLGDILNISDAEAEFLIAKNAAVPMEELPHFQEEKTVPSGEDSTKSECKLDSMSVKELREYAAQNGIDVNGIKGKAAILEEIQQAEGEAPPTVCAGGLTL